MAYIWHPLFFIGNKRSGTSHFVQLLNLSREIHVCPEADLLWLLYQAEHSTMLQPYAGDGDRAMQATVRTCNDILGSNLPIRDRFYESAVRIRSRSDAWRHKSMPIWIGDKKPVQCADPTMRPFIYKHFPDAKCIHLIRHPVAVVSSMIQQAYGSMPWMNCWKAEPRALVESWGKHERWVLEIKNDGRLPTFTIRYSDLCDRPACVIKAVLRFLELDPDEDVINRALALTYAGANAKHTTAGIPLTDEARKLVEHYGLRL